MKIPSCLLGLIAAAGLIGGAPQATLATDYTLPIGNQTGLDPSKYSIYIMGFSYASQQVLSSNGTFVKQTSGTVNSYKVGTGKGQISEIVLDADAAFTGGRIYIFVASSKTAAPTVPYGNQPKNPPDASFPTYTFLEITVPALNSKGEAQPATVDVQTVDGFAFPLTISLGNQVNVTGKQYGQPIYAEGQSAIVNRDSIFEAYTSFMQSMGTVGQPYLGMVYEKGTVAGQPAGILNPAAFLSAQDTKNELSNLTSPLNAIFNANLTKIFSTSTLRIRGDASANGESPVIPAQSYKVTSTGAQMYHGTNVSLPALQFTGETTGEVFNVFNPIGIAVMTTAAGQPITGTINGNLLTLNAPVTGLAANMYVSGAGTLTSANENISTQITAVNGNVLTLNQSLGKPAPNSQYRFSKLPYSIMFQTPGQMVFGNSGVFADNTVQFAKGSGQATVLGSLENWIVSALNRGVAVNSTALNPGSASGTSKIWGDQRNWYPVESTQNIFSLFMHVGKVGKTPIFFQPTGADLWPNARGQVMGSAYGFGFDENGGPVPPAPRNQPEVPSKFDGIVPPGSKIQVTLGPWTASGSGKPTVKIRGRSRIETKRRQIKIRGTATGSELDVRHKLRGKLLTKRVKIRPNGKWLFKFRPKQRKTILRIFAQEPDGSRSVVKRVRIIDRRF